MPNPANENQSPSARLLISGNDFARCPGGVHSVIPDGDEIHLVCRYEDTANDLVSAFTHALAVPGASGASAPRPVSRSLRGDPVKVFGFLITVVLVMVTLGILDVFGNSLHHYVGDLIEHYVLGHDGGGVEGEREFWLLATSGALLCGGVAWVYFSHAPLLEENVESVGHRVQTILRDFVQSRRLLLRRLKGILRALDGGTKSKIHIWNINPSSDGFEILWAACQAILPAGAQIVVHVRSDELPSATTFLRERIADVSLAILEGGTGEKRASVGGLPGDPARASSRLTLLLEAERPLLPFLKLASFPEGAMLGAGKALGKQVSFFSESCFNHWLHLLGPGVDHEVVNNFLRRCQQDYGLLRLNDDEAKHIDLVLASCLTGADSPDYRLFDDASLRRVIKYRLLRSDVAGLLHDNLLAEPLSCLVVIYVLDRLLQEDDLTPPQRYGVSQRLARAFSEWVLALERTERFELLRHVFPVEDESLFPLAASLPKVVGSELSDACWGDAVAVRRDISELTVWGSLGIQSLQTLARLMETSGNYERAARIWHVLSPIQPLVSEVRLARLAERLGKNAEALERIDHAQALLCSTEERTATRLAADVHLEFAWIIYSTGAVQRIAEGQRSLDVAAGLLLQLDVTSADTSMYFWRLHNYTALYQDRRGDHEAAIESHKKALAIPGVKGKWLSGTLVNLAYVQRKAALQGGVVSGAADAARAEYRQAALLRALEYARLAVSLKERLNDKDELPITLHNLALIGICLKLLAPSQPMPEDSRAAAARGLRLLDELGADKKRFALLLESWFAERLAGGDGEAISRALREFAAGAELAEEERAAVRVLGEVDSLEKIGESILSLRLLN